MIETQLSDRQWESLRVMKSDEDGTAILATPTGDALVRLGLAKRVSLGFYKITDAGRSEPIPARMRGRL